MRSTFPPNIPSLCPAYINTRGYRYFSTCLPQEHSKPLDGESMRGALSCISTSFLPPRGLAPVFTTSDPDRFWQNSVRSKPWGLEMSLRCACQSWRFAITPSCLLHPSFQVLPLGGARAFLGPHPFPPSEPGPTSFTQRPHCLLCPISLSPFLLLLLPPAGPSAHTSTLRLLCLHWCLPHRYLSHRPGGVPDSGVTLQSEYSLWET